MDESFWNQEDNTKMLGQEAFYKHFEQSDHLKKTTYIPKSLGAREQGKRTTIFGKKFEFVSFSWTQISNICFRNCEFDRCQFIGAKIDDCEFQNCRFISTNTHKINFSRTLINPRSFRKCLDKNKHQNIGVHLFQKLLNNSREMDQSEYSRDAQFLFLQWKRRQDAYVIARYRKRIRSSRDLGRWLKTCLGYANRLVWEHLFGWCIKLTTYFRTVLIWILIAWLVNFVFREQLGAYSTQCSHAVPLKVAGCSKAKWPRIPA